MVTWSSGSPSLARFSVLTAGAGRAAFRLLTGLGEAGTEASGFAVPVLPAAGCHASGPICQRLIMSTAGWLKQTV